MSMHKGLMEIDKILRGDSDLWKLLYYKSENVLDDPLDNPDLFDLDPLELSNIIRHRLKYTPSIDDLDDDRICRIILSPSNRRAQGGNYFVADQDVDIEVFTHRDYNDADMRLSKLCDRVNKLISDKHIAGMGKMIFVGGRPFTVSEKGYVGYTMTYRFGSGNA